jgi:hypothetical protein
VTIAATDNTATEEAVTSGTFTVRRTGAGTSSALTVFYQAEGTATNGKDYQALTGSVIIPAGRSSATITVTPIDDGIVEEGNETVVLQLQADAAYSLGTSKSTTVTIIDKILSSPTPAVSVSDVQVIEGNSGTINAVFVVTLSSASSQTVMVSYHTADNTAQAGSDYVSKTSSLTFNPGEVSKNITVVINGDTVPEANETFLLILSGATNASVTGNRGVGTIVNDDPVKATWHFDADFDGDGQADIAVYRDGMWFILRSSDGGTTVVGWGGLAQDLPVPGDYDGDGKTDMAVYRDGTWFILRSSDGGAFTVGWEGSLKTYQCQETTTGMERRI